jgi:hypothetical protein
MSEALVPGGGGGDDGEEGMWSAHRRWWGDGVEVTIAIEATNHASDPAVLNGKTIRVKFNCAGIVTGKFTDRKEILNKCRNKKDIIKNKVR